MAQLWEVMLETPQQLGASIRRRRQALGLTQEELALTVDVGPRFIVELEAGKPTCQLGKALAVARAVGIRLADAAEAPPQVPLPAGRSRANAAPAALPATTSSDAKITRRRRSTR